MKTFFRLAITLLQIWSLKLNAADGGLCVSILTTSNLSSSNLSGSIARPEENLTLYLKELLDQNVLKQEDIEFLVSELREGRKTNSIENPEVSISKLVAHESLSSLLSEVKDLGLLGRQLEVLTIQHEQIIETQKNISSELSRKIYDAILREQYGVVLDYFSTPESVSDADLLRIAIELCPKDRLWNFARLVFSNSNWVGHPELLELAIKLTPEYERRYFAEYVFSNPNWVGHPALLELAIELTPAIHQDFILHEVFTNSNWVSHPQVLKSAIHKTPESSRYEFAFKVFSSPIWEGHSENLKLAIELTPGEQRWCFALEVFSTAIWVNHPELLKLALELTPAISRFHFADNVFSTSIWRAYPELFSYFTKLSQDYDATKIDPVFTEELLEQYREMSVEELSRYIDAKYAARSSVAAGVKL